MQIEEGESIRAQENIVQILPNVCGQLQSHMNCLNDKQFHL